jgi:hypothetical protein
MHPVSKSYAGVTFQLLNNLHIEEVGISARLHIHYI